MPPREGQVITFGQLIKRARKAKRLTLREVAQELGDVSLTYLHDIEAGTRLPFRLERLEKLAEILSVDLQELCVAAAVARGSFQIPFQKDRVKANHCAAVLQHRWTGLSADAYRSILKIVGA